MVHGWEASRLGTALGSHYFCRGNKNAYAFDLGCLLAQDRERSVGRRVVGGGGHETVKKEHVAAARRTSTQVNQVCTRRCLARCWRRGHNLVHRGSTTCHGQAERSQGGQPRSNGGPQCPLRVFFLAPAKPPGGLGWPHQPNQRNARAGKRDVRLPAAGHLGTCRQTYTAARAAAPTQAVQAHAEATAAAAETMSRGERHTHEAGSK